jgi:CBS domain-containing protein
MMASISKLADYIQGHSPFDTLDETELARVAAAAESEYHPAGGAILKSAEATAESAYLVRSGSVELLVNGRVMDLLGEGEMFGFASLLDEEPTGFVARAAEDAIVLRFPAEAIRPVLERPAAARFLAGALTRGVQLLARDDDLPFPVGLGGRRVGDLVRATPLVCDPETPVQQAAQRMVDAGVTCLVVDIGDHFGIVTDRDMRTQVVAAGAAPGTPVSAVMTAPAWTVSADRTATEALLDMLDHGVRHMPVLGADRRLLGVIDDVDLMASERRAPFHLRALIANSKDEDEVARAAAELPGTVIALHDAGVPAAAISRTISSIHDTITRHLIELAHEELGPPTAPYTWLAIGSFGRREPFPSSDVDCALAWEDVGAEAAPPTDVAGRVLSGLAACGFSLDRQGAVASSPLFARSTAGWEEAARSWVADPDENRGLMLLSVVVESDPVWGTAAISERLRRAFLGSADRAAFLRRLAAAALAERPPTGFLRDFVLHSSGERRGVLDIKRGGLLPIVALARWSGLAAGVTAASTTARIRASAEAGTLPTDDAAVLRDAFELCSAVRMEHQVGRLRAGEPPDDLIAPRHLAPLTRTALKEAFRAVARVQRGIAAQHGFSAR